MIIQLDEGLLDPLFGHSKQFSHQDHKREKYFRHNSSQLVREKDILPSENGKYEEEPTRDHDKDQDTQHGGKDEGKGWMDVLQPHQGNIPEQKNEKEKDQAGDDQKPNKYSLFRPLVQSNLQKHVLREP